MRDAGWMLGTVIGGREINTDVSAERGGNRGEETEEPKRRACVRACSLVCVCDGGGSGSGGGGEGTLDVSTMRSIPLVEQTCWCDISTILSSDEKMGSETACAKYACPAESVKRIVKRMRITC